MLEQYKEQLEHTRKPAIRINLDKKIADFPWSSKVGGVPYLPTGTDYPVDNEGKNLQFLAQINFAEMPALQGYPSQGILAFYIGTDDLAGADFDNPLNQAGFKVIYFEEVIQEVNQLQIREPSYTEDGPLQAEAIMSFSLVDQIISIGDFKFERILGENYQTFIENEEVYEAYQAECAAQGHFLGGYPYFTQEDPRAYNETIQDYVLLFQLDSDDDAEICWGDVGVANFFIHPDDLKKRDFSRVAYSWDCS